MGRMRGQVFEYDTKAGRRWGFIHDGDPDDDGRRRQVRRRGFTRERDAHTALRKSLSAQEEGRRVGHDRQTVGEYLRAWHKGLAVKPTTAKNYEVCIETHLIPTTAPDGRARPGLGGVRLQKLTAEHLDELYRWLEREGKQRRGHDEEGNRRVGGDPLAPKSVRHVHTCVRRSLADAVERGYVLRNVADLAHPPSQKAARSRAAKAVWSPSQLREFLAAAQGDRWYGAMLLLATTGMRRGEVAGLRWECLDLDTGRLEVRFTATMVSGKIVDQDSAKTDAGERTIALDPQTVAVLKDHRRLQLEERLAAGEVWTDSGRVFTDEIGRPIRPDQLLRRLHRFADDAGLPRVTVHQLRHSYATAALRAGVPAEVLSKRLGHASVAITLDTYRHVQEGEDAAAAALAAGAILG